MQAFRSRPARPRRGSREELALFAEAVLLLGFASLAIRLLPFRRAMALVRAPRSGRTAARDPARPVRAIEAAARRVPWRAVCFQQALALHLMLRRRGVATILHYGIAPGGDRLTAHVWLSREGRVLIGEAGIEGHLPVARFPADAG